eukprot:scaffold154875_cov30-Tisochrysis_lutea.AAC.4
MVVHRGSEAASGMAAWMCRAAEDVRARSRVCEFVCECGVYACARVYRSGVAREDASRGEVEGAGGGARACRAVESHHVLEKIFVAAGGPPGGFIEHRATVKKCNPTLSNR